ncbi:MULTISPECIES: ArsR/SmtB family transcription factor [unclassified Agarivorans]|uniref:ArsR/SmtB family transcription factor n=1 Tax=unclassified Agarivorans TaxID=2636026 RepID=UPI0010D23A0D|nr:MULTISPECIES: metalloregulator ArsR/SmtB family transcription factor [unclassified Agarivorans]MDO6763891.1 metalloregulator ArsR/SmtB family transcription factor [Agarivorans sp. 1_MG-2023]GDY27786.1 transcriptional activator HlyU [Agarivorans sp. Toyoura001]
MNIEDMQKNAEPALKLLKALANESRLMILCHLVEGELTVGELNQRVQLSQSALSQHLAWLRKDKLVSTRKESQTIFYSLASDEAKAVLGQLHALYCAD